MCVVQFKIYPLSISQNVYLSGGWLLRTASLTIKSCVGWCIAWKSGIRWESIRAHARHLTACNFSPSTIQNIVWKLIEFSNRFYKNAHQTKRTTKKKRTKQNTNLLWMMINKSVRNGSSRADRKTMSKLMLKVWTKRKIYDQSFVCCLFLLNSVSVCRSLFFVEHFRGCLS